MTDMQLEQTIETTSENDFPQPNLKLYRVSVEQYHAMIEAGILSEDDHVELLEGWIVEKMPKNPPHSTARRRIGIVLTPLLPKGWLVNLEDPITMGNSEPESDATIVKGTVDDFEQRHPTPAEVALVIEVSDSSLTKDRTIKQRIYARAGIPMYWLINLAGRKLEVYTQPGGSGTTARYAHLVEHDEAASVELVIDGTVVGSVVVDQLLPKTTS